MKTKMKVGNFYKVVDCKGFEFIGEYMGREEEFECSICGKGTNAKCFNIYYGDNCQSDYETIGYGNEHFPTILEDYGNEFHSNK